VEQNQSSFDLRHLQSFCRVAELKNFSKAAEDLFLTQPTVSGHILALENSLGVRLFDRTGREARLTRAGQVLYQYASQTLHLRRDALNALSEFSQGIRGELCLGASTIPGEYILPKLLGEFKREHPHLAVSLKIADTQEIVQGVLRGDVEFGLTGAKIEHPSLQYELFAKDRIVFVSACGVSRATRLKITLNELFQKPLILREQGSGTRMAVEKTLKKIGKNLGDFREIAEIGSTASVKAAVRAGLGFAFISQTAVEEELTQGLISEIQVEDLEPILRQIYLVSHRGRTLSPMAVRFFRYLRKRKMEN
jgi:DNA-binding transcriptional LysR family regulator